MTYPLLKKAPGHNTKKFLQYLVENNVVVYENQEWIVIENCKYNNTKGNRQWHTAFLKQNPRTTIMTMGQWGSLILVIEDMKYRHWEMRLKKTSKRTVERFHIHFIE